MAVFELRYPDENAPTISWVRDEGPQDRTDTPLRGVVEQESPDPQKLYTYTMGRRGRLLAYTFRTLTSTEDDDLEAFEEAVKGRSFRLKDPLKGIFLTVRLRGAIQRGATPGVLDRVTATITVQKVAA